MPRCNRDTTHSPFQQTLNTAPVSRPKLLLFAALQPSMFSDKCAAQRMSFGTRQLPHLVRNLSSRDSQCLTHFLPYSRPLVPSLGGSELSIDINSVLSLRSSISARQRKPSCLLRNVILLLYRPPADTGNEYTATYRAMLSSEICLTSGCRCTIVAAQQNSNCFVRRAFCRKWRCKGAKQI